MSFVRPLSFSAGKLSYNGNGKDSKELRPANENTHFSVRRCNTDDACTHNSVPASARASQKRETKNYETSVQLKLSTVTITR